jgi:hypothetical protein
MIVARIKLGVKENVVCTKVKKLVGCQGDLDGSLGRKNREDGKEYIFWPAQRSRTVTWPVLLLQPNPLHRRKQALLFQEERKPLPCITYSLDLRSACLSLSMQFFFLYRLAEYNFLLHQRHKFTPIERQNKS